MQRIGRMSRLILLLFCATTTNYALAHDLEPRGDLHFPLTSRATNKDGSIPVYKNPEAPIEDRVNDLLSRMTIEEKVSQMYVTYIKLHAFLV